MFITNDAKILFMFLGTHKIFADIDNSLAIRGTPVSVKVYNPEKISVETVEGGLVRQPVKFTGIIETT